MDAEAPNDVWLHLLDTLNLFLTNQADHPLHLALAKALRAGLASSSGPRVAPGPQFTDKMFLFVHMTINILNLEIEIEKTRALMLLSALFCSILQEPGDPPLAKGAGIESK